jgi:hypothetical protein
MGTETNFHFLLKVVTARYSRLTVPHQPAFLQVSFATLAARLRSISTVSSNLPFEDYPGMVVVVWISSFL